eukprot:g13703.t1
MVRRGSLIAAALLAVCNRGPLGEPCFGHTGFLSVAAAKKSPAKSKAKAPDTNAARRAASTTTSSSQQENASESQTPVHQAETHGQPASQQAPGTGSSSSATSTTSTSSLSATLAALVTTLLAILAAFVLWKVNRSQKVNLGSLGALSGEQKNASALQVAIIGGCNVGKTSLFFLLRDDEGTLPLVSSLKTTTGTFRLRAPPRASPAASSPPEDSSPTCKPLSPRTQDQYSPLLQAYDCPGHPRLRQMTNNVVRGCDAVVFVIDGCDKQDVKNAAEYLYDLFTSGSARVPTERILTERTRLLIAVNKADRMTRSEKMVVDELEREIERMRQSRGCALEKEDAADGFLGVEGEKFKLALHSGLRVVETCCVSVTKGKIRPVLDFLREGCKEKGL